MSATHIFCHSELVRPSLHNLKSSFTHQGLVLLEVLQSNTYGPFSDIKWIPEDQTDPDPLGTISLMLRAHNKSDFALKINFDH